MAFTMEVCQCWTGLFPSFLPLTGDGNLNLDIFELSGVLLEDVHSERPAAVLHLPHRI